MSTKIIIENLSGSTLRTTRIRAQRKVDAGSHEWKDEHTIREIRREPQRTDIEVDLSPLFCYDYPNFSAHPELMDHPFSYPLPWSILRWYQRPRVENAG